MAGDDTGTPTRRIRHTLDRDQPVNLTGGPYHVAFPAEGVREVEAERAADLVENHSLIEYDIDLPEDYRVLQQIAQTADTEAIGGNSSKAAIQYYLETLPEAEREALLP